MESSGEEQTPVAKENVPLDVFPPLVRGANMRIVVGWATFESTL